MSEYYQIVLRVETMSANDDDLVVASVEKEDVVAVSEVYSHILPLFYKLLQACAETQCERNCYRCK